MTAQTVRPLFSSFCLHLVLPRLMVLALLAALGSLLKSPVPLLYTLLAADGALFIWQFLRFQASADDHLRSTGNMAPVWGGYLAVLVGGFASISLWWGAFLFAQQPKNPELFTDRMDREHAASYDLTLSQDKQTLHFSGTITFGLTKRARALLATNPQLVAVSLASAGGHIYEARGFAQLIRNTGLNTIATEDCSSACTLLFIAGQDRQLADGARLGFHSYALEFGSTLPNLDLEKEQDKDRIFFRTQGVSDTFLAKMFDEPSSELWHPSRQEALEAGLLTQ